MDTEHFATVATKGNYFTCDSVFGLICLQ